MIRSIALAAALALAGAPPAAALTVFAAASLTDALTEVGAAYEKRTGEPVHFNFAASSVLARQIEEGAPADVFVSADEETMDRLAGRGLIARETRRRLLSNTLAVVVASNGGPPVASPRDLAGPAIRALALAEPRTVPAGVYARRWLEQSGLWRAVESRVVPTENVRAALAAVESGNADAAIVYRTDAISSGAVRIAWEVPASETPSIAYPAAALSGAARPASARRFLDELQSPVSSGVFGRFGFRVLRKR